MRMEFLLLLHSAMHYVQIGLEGVLPPSYPVANCTCVTGTVPATDLSVLIVHQFEGDRWLTRFV